VAEGHRTGEGDMNCMMCFPKVNSYNPGYCIKLPKCGITLDYTHLKEKVKRMLFWTRKKEMSLFFYNESHDGEGLDKPGSGSN
jgi:hypothetical protein